MSRVTRRAPLPALQACRFASIAVLLAGCAAYKPPGNVEDVDAGLGYQAEYRSAKDTRGDGRYYTSAAINAESCKPEAAASRALLPDVERLSPGDLVQVSVEDDQTISGRYEVSQDGTLRLMHVPSVQAKGLTVDSVEEEVRRQVVASKVYAQVPLVSIRVVDFAPARVFVAGAVFSPGLVRVGAADANSLDRARQDAIGAAAGGRRLAAALQASGGVRPDADLSRVSVTRGRRTTVVDLRPAIEGRAFSDFILLEGDQIEVPSRGCFQPALMKPSPVSPVGAKVFMSNLIVPTISNSNAAVQKDARELVYGTRFLDAVFGMNCVGGTKSTNADRYAVLYTRNPATGQSILIERRIEELLRRADRDNFDPYILPGDSLACYDSTVIDITDVARALGIGVATALAAQAL